MWLTKLKIAIVEKDTDSLKKLLDDIPELETKDEAESALYLLKEASELVHILKDETAETMVQIKKNLQFLRSTQEKAKSTLDITL